MNLIRFALLAALAVLPALAHAGVTPSVPTMNEWGLIGLAVGVGSFGAWLISRKK